MIGALAEGAASLAVVASRPHHLEALTCGVLAAGIGACAGLQWGVELVRHLGHAIPDVLLLDVDLDGRHGGLELLLDGRIPSTVTTVLVADEVEPETLDLAQQTGAAGFLVWPFSQAQLDATLCLALALAPARAEPIAVDQHLSQAVGVLRRIARELEQVRHFVPVAAPDPEPRLRPLPGLSELSAREWDVLTGLLDHRRVPELARTLHISPHTVRNHLKSIFAKLGVHSQAELLDKVVDRSA